MTPEVTGDCLPSPLPPLPCHSEEKKNSGETVPPSIADTGSGSEKLRGFLSQNREGLVKTPPENPISPFHGKEGLACTLLFLPSSSDGEEPRLVLPAPPLPLSFLWIAQSALLSPI